MTHRIYKFDNLITSANSLLILGPRGSGKSYYFKELLAKKSYPHIVIDLLSREQFSKYVSFPSALYEEVATRVNQLAREDQLVVFIDEIQLIPDLLFEIHRLIEDLRSKAVFILTGSSARKLKREKVNLLAGRLFSLRFFPFSFLEVDCSTNLLSVAKYGLLPKAYLDPNHETKELYLKSYVQTYLREEIQQEAVVRNLPAFNRFLELSAQNNGATVNFSKFAKIIRVSSATVKQYYQILEDTLIVLKIPAWTHSVKKQLLQADKYYYFDNGVLNALLSQLSMDFNYNSNVFGALFENLVINEIDKYNKIKRHDYKLFHYRTNHGKEIDLILQKNAFSEPVAIEIKSSDYPQPSDVSSLTLFRDDFPKARLVVLCRTNNSYTSDGIEFINWQEGIKVIFE